MAAIVAAVYSVLSHEMSGEILQESQQATRRAVTGLPVDFTRREVAYSFVDVVRDREL
jgi:hypothetical protein